MIARGQVAEAPLVLHGGTASRKLIRANPAILRSMRLLKGHIPERAVGVTRIPPYHDLELHYSWRGAGGSLLRARSAWCFISSACTSAEWLHGALLVQAHVAAPRCGRCCSWSVVNKIGGLQKHGVSWGGECGWRQGPRTELSHRGTPHPTTGYAIADVLRGGMREPPLVQSCGAAYVVRPCTSVLRRRRRLVAARASSGGACSVGRCGEGAAVSGTSLARTKQRIGLQGGCGQVCATAHLALDARRRSGGGPRHQARSTQARGRFGSSAKRLPQRWGCQRPLSLLGIGELAIPSRRDRRARRSPCRWPPQRPLGGRPLPSGWIALRCFGRRRLG